MKNLLLFEWLFCVLCLLALSPEELFAQRFDRYSYKGEEQGPIIGSFAEDKYGTLWMSSNEGLLRFDGMSYRQFKRQAGDSTSMSMDYVSRVKYDGDSCIYFFTSNHQLEWVNIETGKFGRILYEPVFQSSRVSANLGLCADFICISSDSILYGKENLLLYIHSIDSLIKIPNKFNPNTTDPYFWDLVLIQQDQYDQDVYWVALRNGLVRFELSTGRQTYFDSRNYLQGKDGLGTVKGIWQDSDDQLWLSSWAGGLIRFNASSGEFRTFKFEPGVTDEGITNIVLSSLGGPDGNMWVSTYRGLFSFNTDVFSFEPVDFDPSLSTLNSYLLLASLFRDSFGNIWLGSVNGAYCYNVFRNELPHLQFFDPVDVNRRIYSQFVGLKDSTLWFANGEGFGITGLQLDHFRSRVPAYPDPLFGNRNFVGAVHTSDGELLMSDQFGLWKFNETDKHLDPFPDSVLSSQLANKRDLYEDKEGNLWFASRDGYLLYDRNLNRILRFQGPNSDYPLLESIWQQGIQSDLDRRVWLSGKSAVYSFDYKDSTLTTYPSEGSSWLIGNDITDLAIDENGWLWVAVRGDGIIGTHTDHPGDQVKWYSRNDGLSTNSVSTLHVHQGRYMFIGGPDGLTMADMQTDTPVFYGLGVANHLRSNDFNHADFYGLTEGKILIEDLPDGYTMLDPHKVVSSGLTAPVVRLYKASSSRQELFVEGGELFLEPGQRDLELELLISGLALPKQMELRFKLEGLNDEWQSLNEPSLSFSFLPPGEYSLQVQARYPGTPWSNALELAVKVAPRFYQTVWFAGLSFVFVLFLVWFYFRTRLIKLREEERTKTEWNQRLAEAETKALRAQMNPHFIFNSLNSINGFILKNQPDTASEYLTRFSRLMRMVLQNSKRSLVSLKQDLEALELYIRLEQARLNHSFEYRIWCEKTVDADFIEIPPLVLQPYVENAIWHGLQDLPNGEGRLEVQIESHPEGIKCVINDNGIGREKAARINSAASRPHKSMGLQITSERLQNSDIINNTSTRVEIIDKVDGNGKPTGTRVEILIKTQHDKGDHY